MTTKVNLPSIKELRKNGWKIRCSHFRFPTKNSDLTPIQEMKGGDGKFLIVPEVCGGKVVIEAKSPEGVEYYGEAKCSKDDIFRKSSGRSLALARAIGDKTTKFDIEDEVYILGCYEVKKVKIGKKSVKFYIDDDGDVCRNEVYWRQYEYTAPDYYDIIQGPVFATKEELVNSIE